MSKTIVEQTMKECLFKKVEEQEITAKQFGFYWEHIDQLIEQIQSECIEVHEAWEKNDRTHLQEEIGDLLQASISLAIFCNFDPRDTLLKSINKFQNRYEKVVTLAQQDGYKTLHQQPTEVLLDYWNKAKQ